MSDRVTIEEVEKELVYLLKYYKLSELSILSTAYKWVSERMIWSNLRNLVRSFVIEYYRDNLLIKDNPYVGGGVSWHIQVDKKAVCNQKTHYDLSFHKLRITEFLEQEGRLYEICIKCIKKYIRNHRGNYRSN